MQHSKRSYTAEQIQELLGGHFGQEATNIQPLSGGWWSSAYACRIDGGDVVIRFAEGKDAFEKDRVAAAYASPHLPIPRVVAIGEAFGGYYAISERAFGEMLDDLDRDKMNRVVPALFRMLDAARAVDLSSTQGFGGWEAPGIAQHETWRQALLKDADDWQASFADSPMGGLALNEAFGCLRQLAEVPPDGRHLVHNDLLFRNVLVADDRISGLFDWQCSMYGDFLYDIALLAYGAAWFPAMEGIDWEAEARRHFATIGLEVPHLEERLLCCKLHAGLAGFGWCVVTEQRAEQELHAARILQMVRK